MLAFQRMFEVDGAGPAEKRVYDESPSSCVHSYSFSELDEVAALT